MTEIRIEKTRYDDDAARALTDAQRAELRAQYGDDGDPEPDEFDADGAFLVARAGDQAVGCGGIRRLDDQVAEIKRMYVVPDSRGRGVGRAILAALL